MADVNGRSARIVDAVRTQLWPVPAIAVLLALAAGTVLPAMDVAVDGKLPENISGFLFGGGPDAARAVLQAIAGSLITVTSLTFSLTVVTLQLASSQFSPRVLRTFAADRFVHYTLALFMSAFAFALTVLRRVRSSDGAVPGFVPEISVTVAFLLSIASILGLVLFLAHLTNEIRAETMMQRVADETMATLERNFPHDAGPPRHAPAAGPGAIRLESARTGFLTSVDREDLLRLAVAEGAVIRVDSLPGASLVRGVPFATAWPLDSHTEFEAGRVDRLSHGTNAAIHTGSERTQVQDAAFGFRQLADVAARALSPGVNDPTTAVHVLGHLSGLLCQIPGRVPGTRCLVDEENSVRVVLELPEMAHFLDLSMAQPRLYGTGDPEVARRLLELLREVSWCDKAGSHRHAILDQAQRMEAAIFAAGHLPQDRAALLEQARALVAANTA
ncbi:DUF2254 domain-containing protein [Arthrobacter sp. LAPM80]|uniref:DUF2254 domain-containing protein n=1 Tax=Arthrobacter sp. LAPM80 TaxID=3141788 RepID=UPI00398A56EE